MDYSVLSKGRREAFERFGTIHQLPISRSPYDYLKQVYRGGLLLDVGAGKELYVRQLLGLDETQYASLDNDQSGAFTYTAVQDVPESALFDWMIVNQLLEHLTIDEAYHLLQQLQPHLRPGGQMIITVPNVFHPTRYWGDPTHVTHWSYAALYALGTAAGFKIQHIYRYSKNRGPRDPLTWVVERIIRRLYRIDWCDSIMIIAAR